VPSEARPIFDESVPRHGHRPTRTARGDARGCMMVIGVEGRRRADTCGVAWRPPLRARGLTIFRRYFPVQPAADGLAAGGMHASRVCRGRVFGTTARLVCRPQAHLATSAPRGLVQLKPKARRRCGRRPSAGGLRAYRSGGASAASKPLMIIPAGRGGASSAASDCAI
jgi:hypothetical protein